MMGGKGTAEYDAGYEHGHADGFEEGFEAGKEEEAAKAETKGAVVKGRAPKQRRRKS